MQKALGADKVVAISRTTAKKADALKVRVSLSHPSLRTIVLTKQTNKQKDGSR